MWTYQLVATFATDADEFVVRAEGKERFAVAAFPQFFYAPAKLDLVSASASVCEGLVEMASRKLSGVLVEAVAADKKILRYEREAKVAGVLRDRASLPRVSSHSANVFRDLFPASFSALSEKDGEPGPLLRAVTANAAATPSARTVAPDASIAKVIREMVDHRARRVLIQRQDGLIVGSVRASDIFVILLRAQHTSLR
jgi:CBS domain-containing protein